MSTLTMAKSACEQLRKNAEQCYPNECCGVLLGRPAAEGWLVYSAVPTRNADPAVGRRYRIDPLELVRLQRDAARQGLEIAGFYHSHPDHPAQWSPSDLAEAHWLGCSYVITAVAGGRAVHSKAFLLAGSREEDKRFEPQTIVVEELVQGPGSPA